MARYRDSMKAFKASIKSKEEIGNSYAYLGRIYLRSREYHKAYKAFIRAVKSNSNSKRLLDDLGKCLDKLRGIMELPEFIKLYKDTLQSGVYPAPVIYYLINNLHKRGEYEKILKIYENISQEPSFQLGQQSIPRSMSSIYFHLATSHLNHLGNTELALQFATKSIKLDPLNEVVKKFHNNLLESQNKKIFQLLNKANKHFNEQNFDSAQELYNQILELNPGHLSASSNLEKCKLARNSYANLKEARKLLEQNRTRLH